MPTINKSQLDYFTNVIVRNYCRAAEENEILYDEMSELRQAYSKVLQENAELRFQLVQAGVTVPPSAFVPAIEIEDGAKMESSI